jgi:F0F1-type ATP synthase assembly protein I
MGLYLALAQTGLEMVAPIVVGILLDSYLGWQPWGVAVGAVVGLAGGLWHLVVILQKLEQVDRQESEERKPS